MMYDLPYIDPDKPFYMFNPEFTYHLAYHPIGTAEMVTFPTEIYATEVTISLDRGKVVLETTDIEWLKLMIRNYEEMQK